MKFEMVQVLKTEMKFFMGKRVIPWLRFAFVLSYLVNLQITRPSPLIICTMYYTSLSVVSKCERRGQPGGQKT